MNKGFFGRLLGKDADPPEAGAANRARDAAIHELIDKRQVKCAFQPVVDLKTKAIFAYESLARPQNPAFKGPLEMLDAAVKAGRIGELGRILRNQSIEGGKGTNLFINIEPHEFDERFLVQPDDPIFWHDEQIYLEITESVPIRYFQQCMNVLKETRGKGVFLAVDDLGAGFSNLKYISDLEPQLVKLDRDLVAGLSPGTRQFQLVKGITKLCEEMGARVVAEGIETVEELKAAISCGCHLGQGYLLARPAFPPPTSVWPDGVPSAT